MAESISIRPAREQDWAALLEIERSRYGQEGYSPYFLRMVPLVFGATCLVADNGDTLQGYALGSPESGAPHRGWLLSLAVRPAAGKRGIGSALAKAAIDALVERGVKTVLLTVAPDNDVAVALYKKLGFEIERSDPRFFGPDTERLLLRFETSR